MISAICGVVLILFYCKHQLQKFGRGELLNGHKLWLLALVIPLHWLAFAYASLYPPNGVIIAAIVTNIGHSFQYHRLMWFHNGNRYANESHATVGLAKLVNSRFSIYFFTAVSLTFVFALIPRYFLQNNLSLLSSLA